MIGGLRLGIGNLRQPGPGFIFLLASALLILLSVIDFGRTFAEKARTSQSEEPLWSGVRWQKVLLVLIGISTYVFLLKFLGFFVDSFLLMIFLFKAVEPTKWRTAMIGSFATILVAYGIFRLWLKVPFPTGIFSF
jgi:hypothetical protein